MEDHHIGGAMLAVGVSTLALAPSASASDTIVKVTTTYPVSQPSSLPTAFCGFPLDITVVKNQETDITTTVTKKDGTAVSTTDTVFGPLVLTFTNPANGKFFTRDVSGTTVNVSRADGTGTFVGVGNNWLVFGPNS